MKAVAFAKLVVLEIPALAFLSQLNDLRGPSRGHPHPIIILTRHWNALVRRMRLISASLPIAAYLRGVRALLPFARRLQRRDVDGPIRRSRADGRRLDGELDGSRSRGIAASVTAGLQQWGRREAGLTLLPCQSRAPRSSSQGRGDYKDRSDDRKIAERRVPKGSLLGRATAPEDRKILVEDRKVLLVAE
jgi:hypothetical protein